MSLGFQNLAQERNYSNSEDMHLRSIFHMINRGSNLDTQRKKQVFHDYFKKLNECNQNDCSFLKHPFLMARPNWDDPRVLFEPLNFYDELVETILKNFDKVVYIRRNSVNSLDSEIRFIKTSIPEISDEQLKSFSSQYLDYHSKSYEKFSSIAVDLRVESKLVNVEYEHLLEDPSKFITDLAAYLEKTANPLIVSILSNFITSSRQPPEIYYLISTLLSKISLSNESFDYRDFTRRINSISSIIQDHSITTKELSFKKKRTPL